MNYNGLIEEADGSELMAALAWLENLVWKFIYSAELFFSTHTYILYILLGLVILKTIITLFYGYSGWRKSKSITEVYDACGEKYSYGLKRRISLIRPAVEITILVMLIRYFV